MVEHGGMDTSICSGGFEVEGKWIEGSLRPPEPILPSRSFVRIIGCRRTGAKLSERDHGDRNFPRKLIWVQQLQVHDNRGVKQPSIETIRHGPECPGRRH